MTIDKEIGYWDSEDIDVYDAILRGGELEEACKEALELIKDLEKDGMEGIEDIREKLEKALRT